MSRKEIEKKINKGFKTKYITIKRIKIKYDIKIKYEGMRMKKKTLNSINDSKLNILQ